MRAKNYIHNESLKYLRNDLWRNGTLCFWKDNPNYSEKTKQELEKRLTQILQNGKT